MSTKIRINIPTVAQSYIEANRRIKHPMTANLPPQYDAKTTEAKWQQIWETNQTYQVDPAKGGKPFCIVIPPPNVTGTCV
jgi:valyl-tRNA synthetase